MKKIPTSALATLFFVVTFFLTACGKKVAPPHAAAPPDKKQLDFQASIPIQMHDSLEFQFVVTAIQPDKYWVETIFTAPWFTDQVNENNGLGNVKTTNWFFTGHDYPTGFQLVSISGDFEVEKKDVSQVQLASANPLEEVESSTTTEVVHHFANGMAPESVQVGDTLNFKFGLVSGMSQTNSNPGLFFYCLTSPRQPVIPAKKERTSIPIEDLPFTPTEKNKP